jgi:hypothetical protein
MNVMFVTGALAVALAIGMPSTAAAQKPNRRPPAASTTEAGPSEPAQGAVSRTAAAPRDVAPKTSPRSEPTRGEGTRLAPATSSASSDDQERRGAVRRPPSDGGRGQGSQRDRAVARTSPPPRDYDDDRRPNRIYYYPSYYSYGRYYDPFYYGGLHLGYLAYSPWGWTPAFYGYPYGYGGHSYYQGAYDLGAVKIKVKPRDAEVYVDGYYAGTVDDFDGVFQSLKLELGGHNIEVRKPGFETLTFDVQVQPDRTVTFRGEMRPTP